MIQRTLLVILTVLGPLGLALAGDWPQWRGPDRNDLSKETDLLKSWPAEGPKLLWIFRDAGNGYSCPSVVDDRLYSMGYKVYSKGFRGDKNNVFAIDLKTQKKLWSVEVNGVHRVAFNVSASTPTLDGNFLYVIGPAGELTCIETANGKKVWSQELARLGGATSGYGYVESPLVDGDLVIATAGGAKGTIAAFDKKTGMLKWRSAACTDRAAYSSIIVTEAGGVRQYVQITERNVVGVRASDGKLLWKSPFSSMSTPICQNDSVHVSNADGSGCRLLQIILDGDQFNTKKIYANREMQNGCGASVLVGEHLYGYTKGGWMCQEFKTGRKVWKKNPGLGGGSLTFADGNLYCYHSDKADVLLLKATPVGYQERGRFRIPEYSKIPHTSEENRYTRPVVSNGKLYLRDKDLIFCYDIRKPQ